MTVRLLWESLRGRPREREGGRDGGRCAVGPPQMAESDLQPITAGPVDGEPVAEVEAKRPERLGRGERAGRAVGRMTADGTVRDLVLDPRLALRRPRPLPLAEEAQHDVVPQQSISLVDG